MITDVLTIGPGFAPNGGAYGATDNGQTFEINPSNAQAAFNNAVAAIKAGSNPDAGADLYVYPSSTGVYSFSAYADFDIPIRVHWPAGTYATCGGGTPFKMFRFLNGSSGGGMFGLWVKHTATFDNTRYITIDDNGVGASTDHITIRDCVFEVDTTLTDLEGSACIWAIGADDTWGYTEGKCRANGPHIINNQFRFGGASTQTHAWTTADEPLAYGMQGIYALHRSYMQVTGNSFSPNRDTYKSATYLGRAACGGAVTLDNCIHSNVSFNHAHNLNLTCSSSTPNGGQFASDLVRVFIDGADAFEGHHSTFFGNYFESIACRYVLAVQAGRYNVIVGNAFGRIFPCRAAIYIGHNDYNWGQDNDDGGSNNNIAVINDMHNVKGYDSGPGVDFYLGRSYSCDYASYTIVGITNWALGNNPTTIGSFEHETLYHANNSGLVRRVPYDLHTSAFLT